MMRLRPATPFRDAAREYWRLGIPVVPCGGEDGKRPLIQGWPKLAKSKTAEQTLAAWEMKFPDANVGILAGKRSRLTVVDVDDRDLLDDVFERFGETPVIARTGSGKVHLYYAYSGERGCDRLDGAPIDIRADQKCLVIAPPSIRPDLNGAPYTFECGSLNSLRQLPAIRPGALPVGVPANLNDVGVIGPGSRNTSLFRSGIRLAPQAESLDHLTDMLHLVNDTNCNPPLGDAEVAKAAGSAWRMQQEGRNWCYGPAVGGVNVLETQDLGYGDAALLLLALRQNHGWREDDFVLANAMAEATMNWSLRRFKNARRELVDRGYIQVTSHGGRGKGDPMRVRLLLNKRG